MEFHGLSIDYPHIGGHRKSLGFGRKTENVDPEKTLRNKSLRRDLTERITSIFERSVCFEKSCLEICGYYMLLHMLHIYIYIIYLYM